MKIIIPAAGEGTRLRPHTLIRPKPILYVGGKTIIDFILEEIFKIPDIEEVIFIVGYRKNDLVNYVKENYKNLNVSFVVQDEYKGLAHAIYIAKDHIKPDDELFIILGDTIFKADLLSVVKKKENSLGVCVVDNPERFGVALLKKDGVIERLIEKPQTFVSNLALTGLYNILKASELFEAIKYIIENDIKTRNEYQLTDALEYMIKSGSIFKTFNLEGWYDCGEKSTMIKTNRAIMDNKILSKQIQDSAIIPPVFIDKGVVIEKSIIGPYVHISKNSKITSSIIKDSIISDGVNITNAILEASMLSEKSEYEGKVHSIDLGANDKIDK